MAVNKANAIFGFALGGVFSVALIVVAAVLFHPIGVNPWFFAGAIGLFSPRLGGCGAAGGCSIKFLPFFLSNPVKNPMPILAYYC